MTVMPAQGSLASLISPEIQRYMQQQALRSYLGNISQGLMQAATGGMGLGPGLLYGLASGGAAGSQQDPAQMLRAITDLGKLQLGQAEQQRAHKQDFAQEALAAGPRYDPASGIMWNQPPAAERTPAPLGAAEREGLVRQAYPEAYGKAQVAELFPEEPEYLAPTVVAGPDGTPMLIRFPKGRAGAPQAVKGFAPYEKPGETKRQTYQDVAGATRFLDTGELVPGERARKPAEGGGVTEAQMASNREIDNARQALAELQRTLPPGTSISDELRRRMSQYDPLTGLETPDYNSYWGRLGWLAMQSKTGGDRDVGRWTQRLMPVAQPVAPTLPETAASAPSEESGGFFDSLFGRSGATAAPGVGPMGGDRAPAAPRSLTPGGPMTPRGRLGLRSSAPRSIESMSLEQLDEVVNTQGDTLSPADLARIAARLDALERSPQGRFPR